MFLKLKVFFYESLPFSYLSIFFNIKLFFTLLFIP